ncbi:hypothetical protein QYF36_001486 [Acer negundo]|nr:hypothetical protein QYF36_001486 [Acer negundo]
MKRTRHNNSLDECFQKCLLLSGRQSSSTSLRCSPLITGAGQSSSDDVVGINHHRTSSASYLGSARISGAMLRWFARSPSNN